MKILYVGDVMGAPGFAVLKKVLPELRKEHDVDVVIAQAENTTNGKGVSEEDYLKLKELGVDGLTAGNWTLHLPEIYDRLNDPNEPITRPANYPKGTPGQEFKYIKTSKGDVLIVSLLGQIVGRDANRTTDNPLQTIDNILDQEKDHKKVATIVNFHGDYSSEKRVIGYYLDGRVTAVIGDHWHVPTADADILPKGTAHMTDVGMCGSLDSSLGVKLSVITRRWLESSPIKNELELEGRMQFSAVLVDANESTGLANQVQHIYKIFKEGEL